MQGIDAKQEKQWMAEDDARTMAKYQEIMGDKARVNRALKVAKQQAAEYNKKATALSRLVNTGSSTINGGKTSKSSKRK